VNFKITSSSWQLQGLAWVDSFPRWTITAQLILASLFAVATITTLRAALLSKPPIHWPRVKNKNEISNSFQSKRN
jgi:hypothetical protein